MRCKVLNPGMILCALGILFLVSGSSLADPFYDALGFEANRDLFSQAPSEYIDPFTGGLILSHTDIFLPGNGGLDLNIQRVYNSKIFRDFDQLGNTPIPPSPVGLGWTIHFGRICNPNFTGDGSAYFEMPDGSRHPFYSARTDNYWSGYITRDFWRVEYSGTAGNGEQWTVILNNGIKYELTHSHQDFTGLNCFYTTSIVSPDGNQITITYDTVDEIQSSRIDEITDSCGRKIDFVYEKFPASCSPLECFYQLKHIEVNNSNYYYYHEDTDHIGYQLLTEVKPPVGASWVYDYNTSTEPKYELTEVTYPTGGKINYTYKTQEITIAKNTNQYRVVETREESGTDIPSVTWTYVYNNGTDLNGNKDYTRIYASNCNKEFRYYFLGYGWSYDYGKSWTVGLLSQKKIYQGATCLQTEDYEWDYIQITNTNIKFGNDPWTIPDPEVYAPVLSKKTITRDSKTYIVDFGGASNYDKYGNPKLVTETGERGTKTITNEYYDDTAFISNHIVDRIDTETTETTSGGGETFIIDYDYHTSSGKLGKLKLINKYGVITEYDYDSNNGNLLWEKDANGYYTIYDNYYWGVPETIKYGCSGSSSGEIYKVDRDINWAGTIKWEKDGKGNITNFKYDALNRFTEIDHPGTDEANTDIYHDSNNRYRVISKGNSSIRYNYDGFGRIISTIKEAGASDIKNTISYNTCGQIEFQSYPYTSNKVGDTFYYDALDRVTRVLHDDGSDINYLYSSNALGRTVKVTNERDIDTTYTYKAFGNPDDSLLFKVEDPVTTTDYEYNLLGSLTLINPVAGPDRKFYYTNKNFLDYEVHPETNNEKTDYEYDNVGNVISKTDANGDEIEYIYDRINRLEKIIYPSGTDTEFVYDNANNRERMTDSSGTYTYEYNSNNRLKKKTSVIDGQTYEISYDYDNKGNMDEITYSSSGKVFSYPRDVANRINSVKGSTEFVDNFEYHPSGAVKKIDFSNGITTDITFDPDRYWINTIKTGPGSNIVDLDYDYEHKNGNITYINDGRGSAYDRDLEYDNLDRLTGADGIWGSGSFNYDDLGNRTRKSIGGQDTNYQYSGSTNRLTSSIGAESASYTYDDNGNILNNGVHNFQYDYENRLVLVDTGAIQYIYDGDGYRVKKIDSGGTTIYHRDQFGQMISETDPTGNTIAEYVWANGILIGVIKKVSCPSP